MPCEIMCNLWFELNGRTQVSEYVAAHDRYFSKNTSSHLKANVEKELLGTISLQQDGKADFSRRLLEHAP